MILFPAKNIYAQAIIFNTSFMLSSSSFPSFIPHALKAQKFCKVKPIHRNHVFGMTVFYQFQRVKLSAKILFLFRISNKNNSFFVFITYN